MKPFQLFQKPMLLLSFLFITTLAFSQVTEQWVKRYNGPSTENDRATSVAVDGAGNVYVSGSTGTSNTDITTIKYDAAGAQLWLKRYNAAAYDVVADLAVDASGNVYVTGYSGDYGNVTEYVTIKYSAAGGAQLWVRKYKAPTNNFSYNEAKATALAVDASGNVYVTGTSYSSDDRSDYATIKYDAAGAELWVARYNGPANNNDAASSLTVDASGNVYVTGSSETSLYGPTDYATVKYNAAGNQLWVKRYNGPENSYDAASSLAVDASGNVYVTGYSTGSGTDNDYATIKYSAAGAQLWLNRYNGTGNKADQAKSVAVDGAGNVYVTGISRNPENGIDYATIKYDAAGAQLWLKRYNGPGTAADMAQPLAIDASGNVYVTGNSGNYPDNMDHVTIKYSTAGAQLWLKRYTGPDGYGPANAIALDASGNVYVTGSTAGSGTGNDYATIKYSAAGTELWAKRHNGIGKGYDAASALAVDASGNVYVTGTSYSGQYNTSSDYATIKYDAAGGQLWVKRYSGPGNGANYPDSDVDEARAVAVDASGNVYVTGYSVGDTTRTDFATIKYAPDGTELWMKRYNSPWNGSELATALAVDGFGNVYVTGFGSDYETGTNDYVTVKYDAAGTELWVKRYNGTGNFLDIPTALAVDALGNVYVTGSSYGGSIGFITGIDYATIKYDAAGNELWVNRYDGPAGKADRATALVLDASGNVYVTGTSYSSNERSDYATIKYDAAGNALWVNRYGHGGASSLAVDASGNVYVTGYPATIKYNAAGNQLWTRTSIAGDKLALDASGNVYVTGTSAGTVTRNDYITIKYNAAGAEQWIKRYNGPENSNDVATALVVDSSGNVYVTGYGNNNDYDDDYVTVKYTQTQTDRGVYDFTLINADSNEELGELKDGDIINLTALGLPRLTMRANTSPAIVGSVVLRLSGPLSRRQTENLVPYTLFGDDQKRNYYGLYFTPGNYTLTATPYSAAQGKSEKGTPLTVHFTVTNTAANSGILVNAEPKQDIKTEKQGGAFTLAALPNPFSSQTIISFSVPKSGYTTLQVYDGKGMIVERLYQAWAEFGKTYQVSFKSKQLNSGVYVLQLATGKQVQSNKLVLIR